MALDINLLFDNHSIQLNFFVNVDNLGCTPNAVLRYATAWHVRRARQLR
jgi:hypothetical protein